MVNCAKGIEEDTFCRMSEILKQELPELAVLSDPIMPKKWAEKYLRPRWRAEVAEAVQDLSATNAISVYTNPTYIANWARLKCYCPYRISDGLGQGQYKAAIVTRGSLRWGAGDKDGGGCPYFCRIGE